MYVYLILMKNKNTRNGTCIRLSLYIPKYALYCCNYIMYLFLSFSIIFIAACMKATAKFCILHTMPLYTVAWLYCILDEVYFLHGPFHRAVVIPRLVYLIKISTYLWASTVSTIIIYFFVLLRSRLVA